MPSGALLGTALGLVFFYVPLNADRGFVQTIVYVHVPLAIVAVDGFIAGGVMSVKYLRGRDMRSHGAIPPVDRAGRRGADPVPARSSEG